MTRPPGPAGLTTGLCVSPSGQKLKYPTEEVAAEALRRARAAYRARKEYTSKRNMSIETRYYKCPWCSEWHLTSKEEDE